MSFYKLKIKISIYKHIGEEKAHTMEENDTPKAPAVAMTTVRTDS